MKHKSNIQKVLAVLLTALMLVSLTACGAKPEPTVTKFCDALQAFDLETASSCFASEDAQLEAPYTDQAEEEQNAFTEQVLDYMKTNAAQMTYELGETTIDGDTATIPVTFTYVDAAPVITAAMGDYITQAFALAFSGADDSVMEDLFTNIFLEKIESVSTGTATATVELTCIKQDNQWKLQDLSDETARQMTAVMSSNISKAFDAFENGTDGEDTDSAAASEDYTYEDVPAGQTLELATIRLAITGYGETNTLESDFFDPAVAQDGTTFVVLDVDVENITKNTMEFDNDLCLYDSQGREYKPYDDAYMYMDEPFNYTELAPNIRKSGNFVYQVPADAEGCYVLALKAGTNEAYRMYVK